MNRWRARLVELQSDAFAPPHAFKTFKSHSRFLRVNILNNLNSGPGRRRRRRSAPGQTPKRSSPPLSSMTAVPRAHGPKH
jgi:hypothetical protein